MKLAALFLSCLPAAAFAALGGAPDYGPQPQQARQPRQQLRAGAVRNAYTVHESRTEAGTVVREYASDGKVFAVAWDGPVKPDVRRLLGDYYAQYRSAAAEERGSHRRAAVDRSGLVVRSHGHLRAFNGLAWLPTALPPGVTPEELQ